MCQTTGGRVCGRSARPRQPGPKRTSAMPDASATSSILVTTPARYTCRFVVLLSQSMSAGRVSSAHASRASGSGAAGSRSLTTLGESARSCSTSHTNAAAIDVWCFVTWESMAMPSSVNRCATACAARMNTLSTRIVEQMRGTMSSGERFARVSSARRDSSSWLREGKERERCGGREKVGNARGAARPGERDAFGGGGAVQEGREGKWR